MTRYDMNTEPHAKKIMAKRSISILLALLCIAAVVVFAYSFKNYAEQGELKIHYHERVEDTGSNNSFRITTLKPWMTFDYINVVFRLPPDYFQRSLGITDPSYPNLRIDRYARSHDMQSQQLLQTIQQLISSYTP